MKNYVKKFGEYIHEAKKPQTKVDYDEGEKEEEDFHKKVDPLINKSAKLHSFDSPYFLLYHIKKYGTNKKNWKNDIEHAKEELKDWYQAMKMKYDLDIKIIKITSEFDMWSDDSIASANKEAKETYDKDTEYYNEQMKDIAEYEAVLSKKYSGKK